MSNRNKNAAAETPSALPRESVDPGGDGGAGLVFWWLIVMAVTCFAPCMILPAWRDYQAADLAERVGASQVATANAELKNLQRRLHAIRNDPIVVARLARRELEFRAPGEDIVTVPMVRGASHVASPVGRQPEAMFEPAHPPVAIARLAQYLPKFDYDAVFCESPTRETVLAMSTGLFVTAFVVFWPKRRQKGTPPAASAAAS